MSPPAFSESDKNRENRGLGFYYRSIPTNLVFDYNLIKTSINMVTVDFFSYDLTPRKFIGGIQFNYGVQDSLVEIVGLDLYTGRKFTVIPYLFDVKFKVGPSFLHINYDLDNRNIWSSNIGFFESTMLSFSLFKGTNFIIEHEIRAISPAAIRSYNVDRDYKLKFNNSVPGLIKSADYSTSSIITQGLRLGVQFMF